MSDNNGLDLKTEDMAQEKQEPKLSFFSRVLNVFINPKKAMEDIAVKPTILVPMLLSLAIFALLNLARVDLFRDMVIRQLEVQMAENPNIAHQSETILMASVYSGLIVASLSPLVTIFLKGLVSHGITQLCAGKGKLKASISVIAFSYFIMILGEGIRTIIGLLAQNYMVTTSVASAFPNLEVGTPLYALLGSLDVFAIWYLIVSMIGISIVHKISKTKAAITIFTPWVVLVGFSIVIAIINP